jgi:hypothetical protein
MNNMYTRWMDGKLLSLFLEYIEVLKAVELVNQYSQVTERIEAFNKSTSTESFCIQYI